MKPAFWLSIIVAVAAGMPALLLAQPAASSLEPAASTKTSDSQATGVQSIRIAADPSEAVAAYAKAQAIEPNDKAVEEAYVRRMVDFGLPEMADAQALDLIKQDPANGLAWGVAAYMSAKQGQLDAALSEILSATRRSPDELFIQRTAGQLLAWYDVKADKNTIPEQTRQGLEGMRGKLTGKPMFADAYKRGQEFYRAEADAATQPQRIEGTVSQPMAAQPGGYAPVAVAPDEAGYVASGIPPTTYYNTYNYYPSYTDPFAYSSYSAPACSWWPTVWWWQPSAVIIVRDHDRRHFDHDRGRFFDHQRNDGFDVHRPQREGLISPPSNRLPRVTAPMTEVARQAPEVGPQVAPAPAPRSDFHARTEAPLVVPAPNNPRVTTPMPRSQILPAPRVSPTPTPAPRAPAPQPWPSGGAAARESPVNRPSGPSATVKPGAPFVAPGVPPNAAMRGQGR